MAGRQFFESLYPWREVRVIDGVEPAALALADGQCDCLVVGAERATRLGMLPRPFCELVQV